MALAIDAYKTIALIVAVVVYLGTQAPFGERLVTAVCSGLAWPWIVWRRVIDRQ